MNSHKKQNQELFDHRLRRSVKQWLNQKSPPADIKTHILRTAQKKSSSQASWFIPMVNLAFNREYNASSFDRFAHATAYSLQMGVLIL